MSGLTITQAEKYSGYSHKTWLNWLSKGIVKGNKGDGKTEPWVIPVEEVERIRQEHIKQLEEKLDAISQPIPGIE